MEFDGSDQWQSGLSLEWQSVWPEPTEGGSFLKFPFFLPNFLRHLNLGLSSPSQIEADDVTLDVRVRVRIGIELFEMLKNMTG